MPKSKEEANKLYEGKFFYEKERHLDHLRLFGPLENIYYLEEKENDIGGSYRFIKVVDGVPTQIYTEKEILVTTEKL
jgi:hypothetical protein